MNESIHILTSKVKHLLPSKYSSPIVCKETSEGRLSFSHCNRLIHAQHEFFSDTSSCGWWIVGNGYGAGRTNNPQWRDCGVSPYESQWAARPLLSTVPVIEHYFRRSATTETSIRNNIIFWIIFRILFSTHIATVARSIYTGIHFFTFEYTGMPNPSYIIPHRVTPFLDQMIPSGVRSCFVYVSLLTTHLIIGVRIYGRWLVVLGLPVRVR